MLVARTCALTHAVELGRRHRRAAGWAVLQSSKPRVRPSSFPIVSSLSFHDCLFWIWLWIWLRTRYRYWYLLHPSSPHKQVQANTADRVHILALTTLSIQTSTQRRTHTLLVQSNSALRGTTNPDDVGTDRIHSSLDSYTYR